MVKMTKKVTSSNIDLVMDITPCRMPEVPPSTGSKANSRPTAQSCRIKVPIVT
uniref:Uncharacterized protein n=1 Tax=Rhizophora mucronata TaxID=61149 RepID=A0A2P2PSD3_RHIMU